MPGSVLLLQLGEAPEAVRAVHGPFATWYERAWGEPLAVHDARGGGRGLDPRDHRGVIVSGSAASLVAPEPWMDDAADLVVRAHAAGVPVLGVCFGHQLIGHAFGGRVVRNPLGWEMGTFDVAVTDEGRRDALFEGLPATLRVNLVHQDTVATPPAARVRVLASNARTPIQALAVDDHVRGVQFHPEFSGAVVRGYLAARRAMLVDQDPDALIARATDSAHGLAVLANFRERIVARG